MSAKLMGQVWDLQLDHNHQLVLLALADHASDDGGSIYPGLDYLVWKTGYSKRQVQRILTELEEREIIVLLNNHDGGRGRKLQWKLQLSKGVKKSPFTRDKGCQNDTHKKGDILSKGDISDTKRVTSGAIKGDISGFELISTRARGTIIEPSIETSSTTTYAREEQFFDDPIQKFPEITNAVFEALGSLQKSRYEMGTVSSKRRIEIQKIVGMLAHENRTIDEIILFRDNWPKFLNKDSPDPPTPRQMLDEFDRVVNWKPRGKVSMTQEQQLKRMAEIRQQQARGGIS